MSDCPRHPAGDGPYWCQDCHGVHEIGTIAGDAARGPLAEELESDGGVSLEEFLGVPSVAGGRGDEDRGARRHLEEPDGAVVAVTPKELEPTAAAAPDAVGIAVNVLEDEVAAAHTALDEAAYAAAAAELEELPAMPPAPVDVDMTRAAMRIPTDTWVLPRPRPDAYVGGFPLHFERRLWKVLGEPEKVLHPFGGLSEIGDSVDLNETTTPTWVGDAHDLHWITDESYDLVILDPPYSAEEAEWLYSTPPPRWGGYTREAVRVCRTGGHVAVYLDKQPARPAGTRLIRRIVVLTRTWHTPRVCFVFEKLGAQ